MMTTRDLFELASLDVLGLLDEDERREFERAFRAAPAPVQAQVRREQLRMADIGGWLPDEEPPAGLKSKVLGAVSDAMVAVREGRAREHVRAKVGPFAMAMQRNVSPLWRAAAIGLIGGIGAIGYVLYKVNDQYRTATVAQRSDASVDELSRVGGGNLLKTLLSLKNSTAFRAGDAARAGDMSATLFIASNDQAHLLVNLPQVEGGYRLVAVGDDGQLGKTVHAFNIPGGRHVVEFAANLIPAGARLAILPATAANTLASAVLLT